ncbi:MAG: DUF3592 domain-containing protein [Planctomycetota bacterium]|nr:MAG: DUF3592 domain-containing protein [Planctomycetota bacterium]
MRGAIILLIMAIGGPFLAWNGYSHKQFRAKLAAEGATVDATTISGRSSRTGRRGSRSYYLTVAYQGEGRSIQKEMSITSSFYEKISDGDALIADTVKLTYLKSDPEQAIIVDGTPDTGVNLWIGLVVGAIGIGGGGMMAMGAFGGGGSSASSDE